MIKVFTCMLIGLLTLIQSPPSFAQKWGKTSKEELAMKSIPEDPEADAVVLFDIGSMRITPDFDLHFKRHRRIKILTERGKKIGDISISYWHEDKLRKLKAQTIQPDGKKIRLDKKKIFEESTDLRKTKVFSMPAIQVGSVIEYEYEKSSEYLTFLEPWYFQNEEFTKLSQLTILLPGEFSYNCFFNNIMELEPEKDKTFDPDRPRRMIYQYTWKKENLPAIKSEPYMTTVKDYLQAIYFQLLAYKSPYSYYKFAKTWDDIAKIARKRFSDFFTQSKSLKEVIENILPDSIKGIDRVKTVYDYVIKNIETTAYRGLTGDRLKKSPQVLNNKAGSAVEKNFLLINLLRIAGFKPEPVLISTRDHGRFHANWAQLQQFDHVIVHLPDGHRSYYLDTDSKYCPFGLLPPEDLVGKGFLIGKKEAKIITIPDPLQINMKYASTKASIDGEGNFHGHTILRYEAYRGLYERGRLSKKKPAEYVKDKLTDRYGEVSIDSFKINNVEQVDLPLTIEVHYQVPNYAQVVDDMIYLCPVLMNRREANPFKRETRNFPVEYNYTLTSSEDVEIAITEGYQVVETPNPVTLGMPGLKFITNCAAATNKIQYKRHFSTNKLVFGMNQYVDLRNSFERIVNADQCQVVIKRIN